MRSTLGKRWSTLQILLCVLAPTLFAALCVYDALLKYPERGANAASFAEYRYLSELKKESTSALVTRGSIAEPEATLARVKAKPSLIGADLALSDWLTQLKFINQLSPANTSIPRTDFRGAQVTDVSTRLESLKSEWETSSGKLREPPSPLTVWDIPSQWWMFAGCAIFSVYSLAIFVIAKSRQYSWDPATATLTFPDGRSITPADLEDVDKRKWHAFKVHLKIKPSHPTLGGKEIEVNLNRYESVEPWILEMEKIAFPDRAEKPAPAEQPAQASEASSASS
jgi:hypothetical protein